jgi:hypothetical protein
MSDLGSRTNVNSAIDLLLDDLAPDNSILPSDHNALLKDILDTLANGLSVTLRTGNTTSGQNLQVTSGDSIQFDDSSFLGSIGSATLTANRSYSLPDKSGTFALTSESSILAVNSQTLAGNFTHSLGANTLTFDNGTINITNGGLGVLGSGNYTSDGTATLMSFIDSSSQPIMIIRNDGRISVGHSIADSSAVFDIESTTQGFLKPRMTTTERNAIGSPALGLEIFNTTTNQSEFWDGSAWSSIGGGASIYTANDTIGTNRIATLTDTLTFLGATNQDGLIIDYTSTSTTSYSKKGFKLVSKDGYESNWNARTGAWTFRGLFPLTVQGNSTTDDVFQVAWNGGGLWKGGTITLGQNTYGKTEILEGGVIRITDITGVGVQHFITRGASNQISYFYGQGYVNTAGILFGATTKVGTEQFLSKGRTAIQGLDTLSTSTAFEIYDADTTPNKKFEVRNNGDIYTNGTQGFTGSGSYTSFTIENGLITNAS